MEITFPKRPYRTHGGAHVPHHKNTAHMETRVMPPPAEVTLPMTQHIGAPCVPIVKKGAHVYVGTKVADSDAYVSAPIHASVSGTVKEIAKVMICLLYTSGLAQKKLDDCVALLRAHNETATIITTPWDALSGAQLSLIHI